jgi:hypothetical protein
MATIELPDAPWISSSKELPDAPWAQIGKPVAMTSGQAEAETDKALVEKEAGIVPGAVKAGLYSAANTAGMNIPSHAVAAYESVSKNKPYWEAYKEQKQYEEALERQNPTASKIGTGVGLVGSLAIPLGPAAKIAQYGAKAAAPVVGRLGGEAVGSALLGGTLSGASSLIEKQDLEKAARDAALGAGAGAILGPAANAIATRLAGKTPVIDKATGSLTQEAVDVGERVLGRKMTAEDISALQPHLEEVMGKKGVSQEAFKEALLKEQGIDPSRSLVTGRKAPAAAEDIANEARVAAGEKVKEQAEKLGGPRPPENAVAQELHNDLTTRQAATKAQYDLTFSHPGYFADDIRNNVMSNIQSSLAARQVPSSLSKLNLLPGQYGDTAKAYQLVQNTLGHGALPPGVQGPQVPINMPFGTKLDMRNLESVHKDLNKIWSKASPQDRIGIDAIKEGYMDTLKDAVNNGLFYGNGSKVIADMEKARALHSDFMSTYMTGKALEDKALKTAIGSFVDSRGKITPNLDAAAAQTAQAAINLKLLNNAAGTSFYNKLSNTLGPQSAGMDAVNKYIRTYAFDTKGDLSKLPGQIEKFLQPNNMAIASKVFSKEELAQMRRLSDVAAMINKKPGSPEEKNSLFFTALQRFTPGIVSAVSSIFHGPLGAFAGTVASETALRGGQSLGRSRAIKAEEFGAPVVRPEQRVTAPIRNLPAMYPTETETGYEDARPLTIHGPGNRMGRKSGGRVSDRLVAMVDRSKKNINNSTQSLLQTPDSHVAHALEIANRNLEG